MKEYIALVEEITPEVLAGAVEMTYKGYEPLLLTNEKKKFKFVLKNVEKFKKIFEEVDGRYKDYKIEIEKVEIEEKEVKIKNTERLRKAGKKIWDKVLFRKKGDIARIIISYSPKLTPKRDVFDTAIYSYYLYEVGEKYGKNQFLLMTEAEKPGILSPVFMQAFLLIDGFEASRFSKEKYFEEYKKIAKNYKHEFPKKIIDFDGNGYPYDMPFTKKVGFPIPDSDKRWRSVYRLLFKAYYDSVSKYDKRERIADFALAGTLPMESYLRTVDIDYDEMRRKNEKIKKILEDSKKVIVKGEGKKYKTELEIELGNEIEKSDANAIEKGFCNVPGGEVFTTPRSVKGILVGDRVIHVFGKNVPLSYKRPLVIEFLGNEWRIVDGPKNVLFEIYRGFTESVRLGLFKPAENLDLEIMKEYVKNLFNIGEFAINTHPKASDRSRYLIEAEKAANRLHVALGGGFSEGTDTVYHWDIVFGDPRQKLEVIAVKKDGTKEKIVENGRLVV